VSAILLKVNDRNGRLAQSGGFVTSDGLKDLSGEKVNAT